MSWSKWLAIAVGALVLTVASHADDGERKSLTVLHTNDLQGRMLPLAYYDEEDRGGWARLVQLLHELGSPKDAVLILDGGNALGPHTLSQFDSGALAVELMERGGYDAMVVGNHEFGFGLDTLKARASQASFPLLGANLLDTASGELLLNGHTVVERQGFRIGLVGLLSPGLKKVINPNKCRGIDIADPGPALRKALDEMGPEVDFCIVLTHMPEEEVYALACAFPEVELFVSGGFKRPQERGMLRHLVELSGGGRIVTTPERGAFLGRLDLVLVQEDGRWRLEDCRAGLIPLDSRVPEDPETAARIAAQVERFRQGASEKVGDVAEEIEDTPQLVADLVRTFLDVEVGIVNRGTLRERSFSGDITRGDVDYLVRFDDQVVALEVTGSQLRSMAASSKTRERQGQRLIFSGYDPDGNQVAGRPLNADETYRAGTTGYLAAGGDGYFNGVEAETQEWVTLKEMLLAHLHAYPHMSRGDGLTQSSRGAWKSRTKVSGSLARTGVNSRAGMYKGVSFLSGKDAMVWNTQIDNLFSHVDAKGDLINRFRSNFGQVKSGNGFQEAADRLEVETTYTLRQPFSPFVSLNLNTVWTRSAGEKRPLAMRGSSGTQLSLGTNFKTRLGLGVERDFAAATDVVGLEVVPEYRRQFDKGDSFSSTMKVFLGATDKRKISLQHYNSLLINLMGNLRITIDANYFLHRDTKVDELGLKSELQIGLGYTWDRKWF